MIIARRRAWLLLAGSRIDRDKPDLAYLRNLQDPEAFVWRILPHAARTFAACIALLPAHIARAAAVGYLYCRILDTFEDLHPDAEQRDQALAAVAARFAEDSLPPLPAIPDERLQDNRDAAHLLLVQRCAHVDAVYGSLSAEQRLAVRAVVTDMAAGMRSSSRLFAQQDGVLADDEQVLTYCRHVIGHPVVFTLRLVRGGPVDDALREQAMQVGEMVQLANITRDIEKDLRRGIAYHPQLRAQLHAAEPDADVVRHARQHLLGLALARVPAYRHIVDAIDSPGVSLPRASALLMLLFTDRHYRDCARQVGWPGWPGADAWPALLRQTMPAILSGSYTQRMLARVETHFLDALGDAETTTA